MMKKEIKQNEKDRACGCFPTAFPLLNYLMGRGQCCEMRGCCGCGQCACPPCEECNPVAFQVAFAANGGVPEPPIQMIPYGGKVTRPVDPSRAGYAFAGWYISADVSGSPWDFDNEVVTSDMTLYARWEPIQVLVTFDPNGGAPIPAPQMVSYGGKVARPVDPARSGYTFTGWYPSLGFSSGPWDFDTDVVTGDMTLYARWEQALFLVTFDPNGGVPVPAPQMVPFGGTVTRPVDPVRAGYVFVAWYPTPDLTGNPWIFPTGLVTGDVTLYARWLLPV